jgi:hypothetical protein
MHRASGFAKEHSKENWACSAVMAVVAIMAIPQSNFPPCTPFLCIEGISQIADGL